jgi:hypothetical protein
MSSFSKSHQRYLRSYRRDKLGPLSGALPATAPANYIAASDVTLVRAF